MFSASVILNNDQIKALPTTPVTLVPAPGAGKVIQLISAVWICNFQAPYGNFATEVCTGQMSVNNRSVSSIYDENQNGALGSTGTPYLMFSQYQLADGVQTLTCWPDDASGLENKPLTMYFLNNDSNFTGGDPANTIKVDVYYVVVDL